MLKKSERLDRVSFTEYFKKGKKINGHYTTIVTNPYPTFKASVVVGKKVSKKAITRNSIRRRLYALLQTAKEAKNIVGVYIVIAKPNITDLTKKDFKAKLAEEIGRVLK